MIKNTIREVGDVTIVDIAGRITLGEEAGSLKDLIINLVAVGKRKVLLNLAETSYIDSSGIGELLGGLTQLKNHGGEMKLLALTKMVRNALQSEKLYTCFEVYEKEEDAVRSFQ